MITLLYHQYSYTALHPIIEVIKSKFGIIFLHTNNNYIHQFNNILNFLKTDEVEYKFVI